MIALAQTKRSDQGWNMLEQLFDAGRFQVLETHFYC